MDFVNVDDEITYDKLKRLYEASNEAEQKTGTGLNYWDLIYILGSGLWEFTESSREVPRNGRLTLEQRIEKNVKEALTESLFDLTKSAEVLGITKSKLWRLCRKHKITHYTWRKYN